MRKKNGLKTYFVALFLMLLLLILFFQLKNCAKCYINEKQNLQETYVLLSSTSELRYLFLLPITVIFWQSLGVQAVVVLVINSNTNKKELDMTIKFLDKLNVITQIYHPKKLSPTTLSQVIRLFGPVLPFLSKIFTNKTILITSDADLAVFNLSNHIMDTAKGKRLHLYNSNCCKPIKVPPLRGNFTVQQHAIGTISATIETWNEVMVFTKNAFDIDEIEKYVLEEFGEAFFNPTTEISSDHRNSAMWYADQSLISYKIDRWLKRSLINNASVSKTEIIRRIDRSNWPTQENFAELDIKCFDDSHLPTAAYTSNKWKSFLPFLEYAFNKNGDLISQIISFRQQFLSAKTIL